MSKYVITHDKCDCVNELQSYVGKGWHQLISDLIKDIQNELSKTPELTLEVYQVKEKFGGLRFYVGVQEDYNLPIEIWNIISFYEDQSNSICEVCGELGKPTKKGWIKTLCEKHTKMLEDGKSPWDDLAQ